MTEREQIIKRYGLPRKSCGCASETSTSPEEFCEKCEVKKEVIAVAKKEDMKTGERVVKNLNLNEDDDCLVKKTPGKIKIGDLVKPKLRKKPWVDMAGKVVEIINKPIFAVKFTDTMVVGFTEDGLDLLKPCTLEEAAEFIKKHGIDKKIHKLYQGMFPDDDLSKKKV